MTEIFIGAVQEAAPKHVSKEWPRIFNGPKKTQNKQISWLSTEGNMQEDKDGVQSACVYQRIPSFQWQAIFSICVYL